MRARGSMPYSRWSLEPISLLSRLRPGARSNGSSPTGLIAGTELPPSNLRLDSPATHFYLFLALAGKRCLRQRLPKKPSGTGMMWSVTQKNESDRQFRPMNGLLGSLLQDLASMKIKTIFCNPFDYARLFKAMVLYLECAAHACLMDCPGCALAGPQLGILRSSQAGCQVERA